MDQTILEMTKDLVKSQIEHHHLTTENIQQALKETHAKLVSLKAQEDRLETDDSEHIREPGRVSAPVNWKKSITKHAVTCLEYGKGYEKEDGDSEGLVILNILRYT